MAVDSLSYLPDDILVKVDRAAMGVSLETRAPFLDRHVMEFVWRLPLSFRIRNTRSKWVLRQVLYKYVPMRLVERPKGGIRHTARLVAAWSAQGVGGDVVGRRTAAGRRFFRPAAGPPEVA